MSRPEVELATWIFGADRQIHGTFVNALQSQRRKADAFRFYPRCPRFRPDPDADHLGILSALLSWREKRPTSVARTRDALQGQLDDVIEAVGHLVAVLRAFAALKALRESGAPRPSLSEIASEAQVPLDLVATDPSLTAYLEHWPSTTRAQARIQKRKERRG